LWVLSVGRFVGAMGFAASLPFIAIYFHSKFGMSMTEIGLFFGLTAVVRSAFQLVGGEISDRIQRKWLLVHSQLLRSVLFFILAWGISVNWDFWWIASTLLINAIFGAIFHPVANALVSDILPKGQRLDGYAITRAGGNLGWAVGPAIGGFLATSSYSLLFIISGFITLMSGLIFWIMLKTPKAASPLDKFKLSDVIAVRKDHAMVRHLVLTFILYLVVAQLIVPFSVYSVEMVGISKTQLGSLYTINGLMVVFLQIPVTRLLSRYSLPMQLAYGSFLYAIGYGMMGILAGFEYFVLALIVVTTGEIVMSPPSLALTSRLAPEGHMGRYMGIYGFFVAASWSFGPLFGGLILDRFGGSPIAAWMLISSLAIVSGVGYYYYRERFTIIKK
ncbi:MAG: MFS transporter, partial [candidate division Zixibacteria bacterium]|nr:MFS transporter [candidate division Zixibacteria bacterium]